MAKQYEKVLEITGEELKRTLQEGLDAFYEEVKVLVKQGNDCRITITDPDGHQHSTTATVGAVGLGLLVLFAPVFAVLASIATAVAGTAFNYKLTVEKVVEKPNETTQPTA